MRRVGKAQLLAFLVLPGLAALLSLGCGSPDDPWKGQAGPPRVVATFPPLECFVKNVAGDNAGVLTLATTLGPHHYEPTVDETLKLRRADLFLVNGLQLDDHFADKMARNSHNPRLQGPDKRGLVKVGDVVLASHPALIEKMDEHGHHHDHDHGHGHHHHEHGEYDPHIWLGIPQAIAMVEVIRDRLKEVDPNRAADYDRRAAEYVKELKELHEHGKSALANKKERGLVTFHESMRYFADSFGLTIAGVVQSHPGAEADASTQAELLKSCKEKGVRVIATEPQFTQKGAASTLLEQLHRKGVEDAVMIELDPLETVSSGEAVDAGWYARKMKANLDTLAKTLR
jgi:ABC-type Zn uptake system ZnuABC Zn-binding protein ZnuA